MKSRYQMNRTVAFFNTRSVYLRAAGAHLTGNTARCAFGFFLPAILVAIPPTPATADSSSPLLAAYYDRQMAIVDGVAYAWQGNDKPEKVANDAIQVGVGRHAYYVLTRSGELLNIGGGATQPETIMPGVIRFAAGRSGVLAIKSDDTLWWAKQSAREPTRIAAGVAEAAVGDGANYYITRNGSLYVKGKAHRGQYGDGKLTSSRTFIQTASDAAKITAHTGHAIMLTRKGDVMGTGGNIYGPVGRHGLGDKAVRWSRIMSGATAIATGSSHSLAIRQNGTLFAWGSRYGPEPVAVMTRVTAFAAGSSTTIALTRDGILWQWDRGEKPRSLPLN